jgi:hypothetical protein
MLLLESLSSLIAAGAIENQPDEMFRFFSAISNCDILSFTFANCSPA